MLLLIQAQNKHCDPNLLDIYFIFACELLFSNAFKLLVDMGVKYTPDREGDALLLYDVCLKMALHFNKLNVADFPGLEATYMKVKTIVMWLLDHGADPMICSRRNTFPLEWPLLFGRLELADAILAPCVSPLDEHLTLDSFKALENIIVDFAKSDDTQDRQAFSLACLSLQPHLLQRLLRVEDKSSNENESSSEAHDRSDESCCYDHLLPWLVQGLKQRAGYKFDYAVHACLDIVDQLQCNGAYFTSFEALSVIDHPEIGALVSGEGTAGTKRGKRKFVELGNNVDC